MKELIRFVRTTEEDNVYGANIYEVIQFNFDGKGSALINVKNDGEKDYLTEFVNNDLVNMMGLNEDEHPVCYEVEYFT